MDPQFFRPDANNFPQIFEVFASSGLDTDGNTHHPASARHRRAHEYGPGLVDRLSPGECVMVEIIIVEAHWLVAVSWIHPGNSPKAL